MKTKVTLKLDSAVHRQLNIIKATMGFSSHDETIKYLLEKYSG